MVNNLFLFCNAENEIKVGDVKNNTDSIIKIIKENSKASLITFPLLSITGYSCGQLFKQKEILLEVKDSLNKIASISNQLVAVSIPLIYMNNLYLCNVLIGQKKILGIVPKIELNEYEKKYFSSGKKIIGKKIDFNGEVSFSSDLIFYDDKLDISISFNDVGSNLLIIPSCDKTTINSKKKIIDKLKYLSYYSTINYVNSSYDSSTEATYLPESIILQNGDIISKSNFQPNSKAHLFVAFICKDYINSNNKEINLDNITKVKIKPIDLSSDEEIKLLNKINFNLSPYPFVNEYEGRYLDIVNLMGQALTSRARKTSIYNMIIGVSGGLDSTIALLALVKARELEPKIKIIGITLPYDGNTSSTTYNNAINLLKLLKVDVIKDINITKMVSQHLLDIKHDKEDVTYENAQARVRTLVLMSEANISNGMVIGTGDLSEIALGWCTYNGDHMSMYNINSTLPKTLITKIISEVAQVSENKIKEVLLSIVNTPISPELRKTSSGKISQKTESQIGKYDINDFILYYLIKYSFDVKTIYYLIKNTFLSLDKNQIKKAMINFYERFFSQQFKRNCSPDSATISEYSLSPNSFKMPSDASSSSIIKTIEDI